LELDAPMSPEYRRAISFEPELPGFGAAAMSICQKDPRLIDYQECPH
jgi:hypothetical protein